MLVKGATEQHVMIEAVVFQVLPFISIAVFLPWFDHLPAVLWSILKIWFFSKETVNNSGMIERLPGFPPGYIIWNYSSLSGIFTFQLNLMKR